MPRLLLLGFSNGRGAAAQRKYRVFAPHTLGRVLGRISASSGLPWKDVMMRRLLAVRGEARDFRAPHLCTTHVTYLLSLSKNISIYGFSQSQTILILTIDREKIMMFDQV